MAKIVKANRVRRYVARIDTRGKHGRPKTIGRVRDEAHVLVRVSLENLDAIEPADTTRIERYAAMPTPIPPVLATYSDRSCKRGIEQMFVWNGNHRVAAARLRGQKNVQVLVPVSDWKRWRTCRR